MTITRMREFERRPWIHLSAWYDTKKHYWLRWGLMQDEWYPEWTISVKLAHWGFAISKEVKR